VRRTASRVAPTGAGAMDALDDEEADDDFSSFGQAAGAAVSAAAADDDDDDDFSDFGVPARPTTMPLDADDDDDDEFSEFAVPATLSASIGDFDASPKGRDEAPMLPPTVAAAAFEPPLEAPKEEDVTPAAAATLPAPGDAYASSSMGMASAPDALAEEVVVASDRSASAPSSGLSPVSMSTAVARPPGAAETDDFGSGLSTGAVVASDGLVAAPDNIAGSLASASTHLGDTKPSDATDDFNDFGDGLPPAASAGEDVFGDDDDDFGGFADSSQAKTASVPAGSAPVDEDNDFGGLADAPAPPASKDDDGFGEFNDFKPAATDDDDDFGGFADATKPAASADDDFGDFDTGACGGDGFDSFGSAPAPTPPPVPQPTASAVVPASAFDGTDTAALKIALLEALRSAFPPSDHLQGTGVTGCPTLDQVLSQQLRSPGGPAWNTSIWQSFDTPEDAWSWSDSLIEQSLLQALGMPPRNQDGPITTPSTPRESPSAARLPTPAALPAAFDTFSAAPAMPAAPTESNIGGDDAAFGGFTSPAPAAFGGDDPFGGFASPTSTEVKPPATAMDDDFGAFGGFGTSSSVPPPAPPPVGVSPMDFDLSQLGGSAAPTMPPPMAAAPPLGNMPSSLDPMRASVAPGIAKEAWLAKLPDLAFVLKETLDRPSMVM